MGYDRMSNPARAFGAPAIALLLSGLPHAAAAQSLSLNLGPAGQGQSLTLNVVLLIGITTVLAVAPGILIVATSFTRLVIVLSLLRTALGLQQSPPNIVIISLALFLTAFIMSPVFEKAYHDALYPLMQGAITEEQAFDRGIKPFRGFMEANTRERDLKLFVDLSGWKPPDAEAAAPAPAGKLTRAERDELPLRVLCPAFLIGEISRAFQIGFLLFLPFLVIDIVVSSVLMGMGMMMLPPVVVSLPFKLIFFVLVNGWELVAGSLVRGFVS